MRVSHYLMAATAIVLASCGSPGNQSSEESTASEPATEAVDEIGVAEDTGETEAAPAGEADVTLTLNADDMMKFDKTELKVKAGQTVELVLNHVGKMGKDVMGHNFVLLQQGVDIADFGSKALSAKDNDYIPESESANIIAHTKLLAGGESDTITFTAPAAGTYPFLCSFPGHYGVMQGEFIVE